MVFQVTSVIPVNTTRQILFDVETPKDTTAVMVVKGVVVLSSGENLGNLINQPTVYFTETVTSQLSTTQNTYATLDLGTVTNDG